MGNLRNTAVEEFADTVVVERVCAGRNKDEYISPSTRLACVRRLHKRGWSDGQIALRVRCSRKQVFVLRRKLGLPANFPSGNDLNKWKSHIPRLHHKAH